VLAPERAIKQECLALSQIRSSQFIETGQSRQEEKTASIALIDDSIAKPVALLWHSLRFSIAWRLPGHRIRSEP
jgi:hypothetical protein